MTKSSKSSRCGAQAGKSPQAEKIASLGVLLLSRSAWKHAEVPAIVAKLKRKMQSIFEPGSDKPETEAWESVFPKYWDAQQGLLKIRADRAGAVYDDLAKRAAASAEP